MKELISKYEKALKDETFPFEEYPVSLIWKDFLKAFLDKLGWDEKDIEEYIDKKGPEGKNTVFLKIEEEKKILLFLGAPSEPKQFEMRKILAKTKSRRYEFTILSNFETTLIYRELKEIYAYGVGQLIEDEETIFSILSKEAVEKGRFLDVFGKLSREEVDEKLLKRLNILREDFARSILTYKPNWKYLQKDGGLDLELLNEVVSLILLRFMAFRLAEDAEIYDIGTLRMIYNSFKESRGKIELTRKGRPFIKETLYETTQNLFQDFQEKYDGGLFLWHLLDKIHISDSILYELFEFFSRWHIPREKSKAIGFTYERFLSQDIDVKTGSELEVKLLSPEETKNRRKTAGIYYTPGYIVEYIVKNTLGRILEDKRRELENAVDKIDTEKFLEVVGEVKGVKVLDPAVGSGSFLVEALNVFKEFYRELDKPLSRIQGKVGAERRKESVEEGQVTLVPKDKRIAKLQKDLVKIEEEIKPLRNPGVFALKNNIYGVDLDPKAVDIAAFTLMTGVFDEVKKAKIPTLINENLKVGNSLISGIEERKDLEKFSSEVSELIRLRKDEKEIAYLDNKGIRKRIEFYYDLIITNIPKIKKDIRKILNLEEEFEEWLRIRKSSEGKLKFLQLIFEYNLAIPILKWVYFNRMTEIKERVARNYDKNLIRYFNSKGRVLKEEELEEILNSEELGKELVFVEEQGAFNWELEFPEVFFNEDGCLKEKGGFDVIMANPPYIRSRNIDDNIRDFFSENYTTTFRTFDIYIPFYEISFSLIKEHGLLCFIVPHSFLDQPYAKLMRKTFLTSSNILKIADLHKLNIFEGVGIKNSISIFEKSTQRLKNKNNVEIQIVNEQKDLLRKGFFVPQALFEETSENMFRTDLTPTLKELVGKIEKNTTQLGEIYYISKGIEVYIRGSGGSKREFILDAPTKPNHKIYLEGKEIARYEINWQGRYISYEPDKHCSGKFSELFENKKILIRNVSTEIIATLDKNNFYVENTLVCCLLKSNLKNVKNFKEDEIEKSTNYPENFVLGVINSALMNWYFLKTMSEKLHIYVSQIANFPIYPATPDQQKPIITLVEKIITLKKKLHDELEKRTFRDIAKKHGFGIKKLWEIAQISSDSNARKLDKKYLEGIRKERNKLTQEEELVFFVGKKKLFIKPEKDYLLDFIGLYLTNLTKEEMEELNEKYGELKIVEKMKQIEVPEVDEETAVAAIQEWMMLQTEIEETTMLIERVDRGIDRLVYDLYGLTEEEVKTVEESLESEYGGLPRRGMVEELVGSLER